MNETAKSMHKWANDTFGQATLQARALNLLDEVIELCLATGLLPKQIDDSINYPTKISNVSIELADCNIMLQALSHMASVDLDAATDIKMELNRKRTWIGNGHGQHVEE